MYFDSCKESKHYLQDIKTDVDNLKTKISTSFSKEELESIESTAKKAAVNSMMDTETPASINNDKQ